MENKILSAYENRPRTLWSRLALGAVLVALMAWSATAAVDYTGASGGGQIAASIISGILHPDLSLLFNFTTEGVPYLMLETICIAFLGTVVGAVLAIPLSFLTASNLVPKPIAFVGRMAIVDHPYRAVAGLWPDVCPGHRYGRLCRSDDHGALLHRHGVQDVYRGH